MVRIIILFALFLQACSCGGPSSKKALRIGIDPYWYPIDFGAQQSYVNGFIEDLLLEIAVYSGLEFEKIPANWDSLLAGMKEKKFDAVITSLPPYSYNMAKYNFSQNFLDLGPVLVVPMGAKLTELSHMEGELVGVIAGDPSVLLLQKYGDIIVRNYPGIPDLLDAIVAGEIQAALLSQIPAVSYVKDLYQGQLKIASEPLTQEGLHLASPKENEQVVRLFNKSLDQMKKKKKIQMLLKKWQLCE